MGHLIVYPDNKEKLTALKTFIKVFKITFLEEKASSKSLVESQENDFWTE